jgi:protein SCO1/2
VKRLTTLALAAALVVPLAACGGDEPHEFAGYVRTPEPQVDVAALPNLTDGGADFELRAEPGNLLLTFFGYTNCPDFCPTTLADTRAAVRRLDPADAERIDVAMITVDPDRDLEALPAYVQSFDEGWIGLGTDDADLLATVAAPFGASYQVDGEEVAHSTQLYAIDDQGRLVMTWPFGIASEQLAGDLEALLEAQESTA